MNLRTLMRRTILLPVATALLLASCGSGPLTLTEYVDRLDVLFDTAVQKYEAVVSAPGGMVLIVGQGVEFGLDTGGQELTDFSTQDLQVALEGIAAIQDEVITVAVEIDPPEELAELHDLFFRTLPVEPLAARAGSTDSWEELSSSPEMEAYRSALAADRKVCAEFQATLDATEERGTFADSPWIPGRLKEIVDYAVGCDAFPADPENVFRP